VAEGPPTALELGGWARAQRIRGGLLGCQRFEAIARRHELGHVLGVVAPIRRNVQQAAGLEYAGELRDE